MFVRINLLVFCSDVSLRFGVYSSWGFVVLVVFLGFGLWVVGCFVLWFGVLDLVLVVVISGGLDVGVGGVVGMVSC